MKKYILYILYIFAAAAHAQYVPVAFTPPAGAAGTNIAFVGNFTANTSSGSSSLSQAYTCQSTSNRLIIEGEGQSGSVTSMALTDTGGQAPGNVVFAFTQEADGVGHEAWNVGCASGANTFTLTLSGATAGIVIQFYEASGVGTTGTGTFTFTSTGPTFTGSATASSSGMLGVAFGSMSNRATTFTAVTAKWNYRQGAIASGGNPSPNTSYPQFDNLNVASGSVSFTYTASGLGSGTHAGVLIVLVAGTAAPSPNWYPYMIQSASGCASSPTAVFPQNVTSGDLITVAFGSEATGTAPTSITDTLSTTYTLQVNKVNGSVNAIWLYTGVAGASGADTVTPNGSGFSSPCIQAVEFNGPGQNTTDTGGQTTSSGSMTWTQMVSTANSIVYASCRGWHGATTFQFPGPFFTGTNQANGDDAISGEWARTTTTSSVTPIFTVSTTDNNVCASITVH